MKIELKNEAEVTSTIDRLLQDAAGRKLGFALALVDIETGRGLTLITNLCHECVVPMMEDVLNGVLSNPPAVHIPHTKAN